MPIVLLLFKVERKPYLLSRFILFQVRSTSAWDTNQFEKIQNIHYFMLSIISYNLVIYLYTICIPRYDIFLKTNIGLETIFAQARAILLQHCLYLGFLANQTVVRRLWPSGVTRVMTKVTRNHCHLTKITTTTKLIWQHRFACCYRNNPSDLSHDKL